MTFKDLDELINAMEKEHEDYVKKTEQRIKTLKDEVEKLRREYAKEVNPDDIGVRDYIVERAKYYFGDKFIVPENSPELLDEFYDETKRKIKPKEVVIVLDQMEFADKQTKKLSVLCRTKKDIENSTYHKIFFCNDAFYVMGSSEIAWMYRYEIIDGVDVGRDNGLVGSEPCLDITHRPEAEEGKDYIENGINGFTGGGFYIMSDKNLKLLKKLILDIVEFVNEQK